MPPAIANGDELPADYNATITDAANNRLGGLSTDSTGDTLVYDPGTPGGNDAEIWTWDNNLCGYVRGGIVWRFYEDLGGWIKQPINQGPGPGVSQGGYFYTV